ncbi:hypothetical protein ZIOFF_009174 [Zingiber officinale]|uniref:RING-type E3 ubiquitin transferase n=1 Tax=Zingiber officinale TaxID=94328 RepID=A0A8J5HGZ1_ZINOF|nr:hypothetical protein ZIOFF_009174 [Zingiber officinale]
MEAASEMENHLSSASAFVEGGIQDACDDACSICLESFCSDPSTVTGCKHEFHLQCILEWCQRSSHCPMCWQTVSLKDPASQELLEAVEHERSTRHNRAQTTTIFHHPAFGDSDLQHVGAPLPVVGSDAELEERIFQHLAAAVAMGRAHHIATSEGRVGSGSHNRSQYSVFSTNSNASSVVSAPAVSALGRENESVHVIMDADPSPPTPSPGSVPAEAANGFTAQATQFPLLTSGTNSLSNPRTPIGHSSPFSRERPGPSESQPVSENLKSRWNAVSMRYKESIVKNTRGWRERLLSRSGSMADIGSGVRREVRAGIATVTRMMERLDTREGRTSSTSAPPSAEVDAVMEPSNADNVDLNANRVGTHGNTSSSSTHWVATSGPK